MVLEVLEKLNNVPPERKKAFRARIQHYQRLKIVPSSPGTGKFINYTEEDIYKWAFCIELAEFGIEPTVIASIVNTHWNDIKHGFFLGGDERWKFYLTPSFATRADKDKLQFIIHYEDIDSALTSKGVLGSKLLFPGPFTDEIAKRFKARHIRIEFTRIVNGVKRAFDAVLNPTDPRPNLFRE